MKSTARTVLWQRRVDGADAAFLASGGSLPFWYPPDQNDRNDDPVYVVDE